MIDPYPIDPDRIATDRIAEEEGVSMSQVPTMMSS
jgi:hypothetical protein